MEFYTIQTYYPPSTDPFVTKALDQIPGTLQRCASAPANYIKADDGAAIENAFEQIFAVLVGKTRLVK